MIVVVVVVLVLVEEAHEQPRVAPVPLYDISVGSKRKRKKTQGKFINHYDRMH